MDELDFTRTKEIPNFPEIIKQLRDAINLTECQGRFVHHVVGKCITQSQKKRLIEIYVERISNRVPTVVVTKGRI